ncbi:Bacteriophage lambda head decoration protein D [Albimonas donghaensis]|uniref:Bacteriophage lambda head decoration protein D n=1 Tax=Albimonas donghaensis TaxID=356660 RepID=A0A1H3FJC0_9RHOB|nr:head decoration protein [Albimonas donghaensis]SDX90244.1 Bacteriophage lambda head decoration protein D [Albimonas donghaensis]
MVSRTTETYDPSGLLAGGFPVFVEKATIADSVALAAGAVLGRITTGGKYLLSASGASDGSQAPKAILAEAADASDGDVEALVYVAGSFDVDKLSFGTGHTAASVATALRAAQAPLFLVSPVA